MRYNSNVLKMKTTWSLYRKTNFKLLINNYLGPAWRRSISKMFGYLFFSALVPQANISTPSTLVFLLPQKFEFTLHFRYCGIIIAWSGNFNFKFNQQTYNSTDKDEARVKPVKKISSEF